MGRNPGRWPGARAVYDGLGAASATFGTAPTGRSGIDRRVSFAPLPLVAEADASCVRSTTARSLSVDNTFDPSAASLSRPALAGPAAMIATTAPPKRIWKSGPRTRVTCPPFRIELTLPLREPEILLRSH